MNNIIEAKRWGVYVHVPFCVSRCNYCDFNTYSGMERHADAYFATLAREIGGFFCAGVPEIDTIFFGGGTPSSVDASYITRILSLIPRSTYAASHISGAAGCVDAIRDVGMPEITLEANPGTLTADKLAAYAKAGVNRLSVGLQSTHDAHLKMLGRIHTYDDFINNYNAAVAAGFKNISADLIFGLPRQTMPEWKQTLDAVVSLGVRHLSCYSLSLEEGTALHAAVRDGKLPAPDEELDREMYYHAVSFLRTAGLYQYELSNFAEPGRECRHNLKYWTGAPYRGFGAGAHSYCNNVRFSNVRSINNYIDRINSTHTPALEESTTDSISERPVQNGAKQIPSPDFSSFRTRPDMNAVDEYTNIEAAEKQNEFIILRLRLTRGFSDAEFQDAFGCGFLDKYKSEVADLASSGLLSVDSGCNIRLTTKGMDLANQVFIKFI